MFWPSFSSINIDRSKFTRQCIDIAASASIDTALEKPCQQDSVPPEIRTYAKQSGWRVRKSLIFNVALRHFWIETILFWHPTDVASAKNHSSVSPASRWHSMLCWCCLGLFRAPDRRRRSHDFRQLTQERCCHSGSKLLNPLTRNARAGRSATVIWNRTSICFRPGGAIRPLDLAVTWPPIEILPMLGMCSLGSWQESCV